jgi:hypothetical protein
MGVLRDKKHQINKPGLINLRVPPIGTIIKDLLLIIWCAAILGVLNIREKSRADIMMKRHKTCQFGRRNHTSSRLSHIRCRRSFSMIGSVWAPQKMDDAVVIDCGCGKT